MTESIHPTLLKFHVSLNVADIARSIGFYRALLGTEPAKVRPDYAKFELDEPALILSLIPGKPGANVNHAGLRVRATEELVAVQRRLEEAGLSTKREDGVECCYALQTKFWTTDPDGMLWEVYVFHEDLEEHGDATIPVVTLSAVDPPPARPGWTHRLGEAFPERIPAEDNTLFEVELEGSVNADPQTPLRATFMTNVLRVLRPGGEVRVHGLVGDAPSRRGNLDLPFPASAVEYAPTAREVVAELAEYGFADIQIDTLSSRAYFVVDGVSMREIRVRARKPGHRPRPQTHRAIYLGPFAQLTDDFGNVYKRGEPTAVNIHDWQALANSAASSSFLLLAP